MFLSKITEEEITNIHHKYYSSEIENKNGINIIDYDTNSLELLSVRYFKFIVHKNDTCVADCLRSGELFEKFIITYIRDFIDPTKNIIDLGANIGTHSIIYSNYTSGFVYSFEPQKVVFDILTQNIILNNCKNVIAYNFGGSNTNNTFYMNSSYETKDNHGAFRIDNTLNEKTGLKIECKIIDELNIENVGYIKIDVEGHEYEALLGMKNIINNCNPIILIEIHNDCITKNETLNLLHYFGYNKYYKMTHCDYIFIK
jgi:FkbM family methyltransferase